MSVWFTVASVLIVMAGTRGLPAGEALWVRRLLVIAIAVRVVLVAGLFLFGTSDHMWFNTFFGDEQYLLVRSLRLRQFWLGTPMSLEAFFDLFDSVRPDELRRCDRVRADADRTGAVRYSPPEFGVLSRRRHHPAPPGQESVRPRARDAGAGRAAVPAFAPCVVGVGSEGVAHIPRRDLRPDGSGRVRTRRLDVAAARGGGRRRRAGCAAHVQGRRLRDYGRWSGARSGGWLHHAASVARGARRRRARGGRGVGGSKRAGSVGRR